MQWRIGTATTDITPGLEPPVYLAGFMANRIAAGVMEPLRADVLYLAAGDQEVALVTADLIGLLRGDLLGIRKRVKSMPRERVLVCSTHTHSGPDTIGMWGRAFLGVPFRSGVNPEYMHRIRASIADAVERAKREATPGRLLLRTFDAPDRWVTNHRKGGGRYDRTHVLIAQTEESRPEALLVNFACHPEGLWEHNNEISPDLPGPMRRQLEAEATDLALFFNGPLGGMLTPDIPKSMDLGNRKTMLDHIGRNIAEEIHRRVEETQELKELEPVLAMQTKVFKVENRNWRFKLGHRLGVLGTDIQDGMVETEMNLLALGEARVLTVPGEPLPELGHQLNDAAGDGPTLVLALGCDELGYILPEEQLALREYSYEKTMTLSPELGPTVRSVAAELAEGLDRG